MNNFCPHCQKDLQKMLHWNNFMKKDLVCPYCNNQILVAYTGDPDSVLHIAKEEEDE